MQLSAPSQELPLLCLRPHVPLLPSVLIILNPFIELLLPSLH
jgi:hypothetical protein